MGSALVGVQCLLSALVEFLGYWAGSGILGYRPCWCPSSLPSPSISRRFPFTLLYLPLDFILRRAGFLPPDFPSFDELARNADAGLLRSICSNPNHVLRHYFTDKRPTGDNLRPRAHSLPYLLKTPEPLFLGPFMQPC